MSFRSNEEQNRGRQAAEGKLLGRALDAKARAAGAEALQDIIDRHGPVIELYPSWHPIVADNGDLRSPVTYPGSSCGYLGLDHTVYLRNGFITCPYGQGDRVVESVNAINRRDPTKGVASLHAERLDVQLYHPAAEPVLVTCEWGMPMNSDGTIPKRVAVPLLLEREIRSWRTAEVAETWKTMRTYFLGQPCGSRSSLFVNEETGQVIKSIWTSLINTGMWGPIYVG